MHISISSRYANFVHIEHGRDNIKDLIYWQMSMYEVLVFRPDDIVSGHSNVDVVVATAGTVKQTPP